MSVPGGAVRGRASCDRRGEGFTCLDIDECREQPGIRGNDCCVNTRGGYECRRCSWLWQYRWDAMMFGVLLLCLVSLVLLRCLWSNCSSMAERKLHASCTLSSMICAWQFHANQRVILPTQAGFLWGVGVTVFLAGAYLDISGLLAIQMNTTYEVSSHTGWRSSKHQHRCPSYLRESGPPVVYVTPLHACRCFYCASGGIGHRKGVDRVLELNRSPRLAASASISASAPALRKRFAIDSFPSARVHHQSVWRLRSPLGQSARR